MIDTPEKLILCAMNHREIVSVELQKKLLGHNEDKLRGNSNLQINNNVALYKDIEDALQTGFEREYTVGEMMNDIMDVITQHCSPKTF